MSEKELKNIDKQIAKIKDQLNSHQALKNQLNSLQQARAIAVAKPSCSDHALLRYIERVLEIDVEKLRGHILKQSEGAINLKAKKVVVDGVCFLIGGKTIATIWKDGK